jgi:hypothetical protein
MKQTETEDTITIEGDLILTEDYKINKNLVVRGDIKGYYNINALNIDTRNIDARNINAWDINAGNIDALNINARNINAWDINVLNINALNIDTRNIDARNINAWDINAGNIDALNIDALNIDARNIIFCDKIKVKKGCKVICKVLITDRFNIERKEQKLGEQK